MSDTAGLVEFFGSGAGTPPRRAGARRFAGLWRALWTPYTVLVYIPYLLASTIVFGLLSLLGSRLHRNLGLWFGCAWAWLLCLLAFTPVSVRGRQHLRRGQSYVVMLNHQSYFDVLALMASWWRPFSWVMKQELRRIPIFGRACADMGHVYVDRSNRERATASLRAAAATIRDGRCVMFFPEGTRSPDGRLLPFKKGGFVMAEELGLPVLPITISGSRRVLPVGSARLAPGLIRLTIHPPLDTAAYGGDRQRLMDDARAAIASALPAAAQEEQG